MINRTQLRKLKLRTYKGVEGHYNSDIEKILTKEQMANFNDYMYGQTVLYIGGKDGKDSLIYRWDFEKWIYFQGGK